MAHRSLKVEVNSSRSTFLSQLTAVNKVTPGINENLNARVWSDLFLELCESEPSH